MKKSFLYLFLLFNFISALSFAEERRNSERGKILDTRRARVAIAALATVAATLRAPSAKAEDMPELRQAVTPPRASYESLDANLMSPESLRASIVMDAAPQMGVNNPSGDDLSVRSSGTKGEFVIRPWGSGWTFSLTGQADFQGPINEAQANDSAMDTFRELLEHPEIPLSQRFPNGAPPFVEDALTFVSHHPGLIDWGLGLVEPVAEKRIDYLANNYTVFQAGYGGFGYTADNGGFVYSHFGRFPFTPGPTVDRNNTSYLDWRMVGRRLSERLAGVGQGLEIEIGGITPRFQKLDDGRLVLTFWVARDRLQVVDDMKGFTARILTLNKGAYDEFVSSSPLNAYIARAAFTARYLEVFAGGGYYGADGGHPKDGGNGAANFGVTWDLGKMRAAFRYAFGNRPNIAEQALGIFITFETNNIFGRLPWWDSFNLSGTLGIEGANEDPRPAFAVTRSDWWRADAAARVTLYQNTFHAFGQDVRVSAAPKIEWRVPIDDPFIHKGYLDVGGEIGVSSDYFFEWGRKEAAPAPSLLLTEPSSP